MSTSAPLAGPGLHQLDDSHLSGVAAPGTNADNAGIAAVAVGILGAQLLKQLVGHVLLGDKAQRLTVGSQAVLLSQGDHLLGHGLSLAVGFALAGRVNGIDYMNYVLTGDGELNEGSNWEAAMSAAQFKLSNVVVLADVNKCMIDGRVDDEMKVEPVDKKFEAFGFNVIRVDGHNFKELNDAIESAIKNHQNGGDKPTAIVMDTFKGEGVDFMKDNYLWHYGSLDEEKTKQAYASLDAYYKERCERAEKEA